jgi:hypothetical protein
MNEDCRLIRSCHVTHESKCSSPLDKGEVRWGLNEQPSRSESINPPLTPPLSKGGESLGSHLYMAARAGGEIWQIEPNSILVSLGDFQLVRGK